MATLDAALAWAARGFRVFPIRAGTKDQPLFAGWNEHASSDPLQIAEWWSDPFGLTVPDHNIGCLTTGMVVVDADPKRDGLASAFAELDLGLDTLIVRTPSGGLHFYYRGPDSANSVGKVAAGVDIRSHNGYTLAPGSLRPDGAYVLEVDAALAQVPPRVLARLRPPESRQEASPASIELDRPDAIALVEQMLARQDPAIEGMGGDAHTYETACKCRDLGVSDEVAWALMAELWNPRCIPPWDLDELRVKVRNAFDYATGQPGGRHPDMVLSGVNLPTIETPPAPAVRFGNAKDQVDIPKRDWRIGRLLLRKLITMLIAPGGVSKSTIALIIAAHKALGRDFAGLPTKPGKTVIYNSEDDLDEQSRRLNAICVHYGFDFNTVRSQIYLIDREMIGLKLTENNPPVLNGAHVNFLIEACSDPECDLLVLDPLVSLLSASEDDNMAMDYVMDVAKIIAREANVALMLVHHAKKPQGQAVQAGDVMSGRGASSTGWAARIALTLATASEQDCDERNIPKTDRFMYVRMDDAKMNNALIAGQPIWFRKHGVKLLNGDEVGVVAPVDLTVNEGYIAVQMAQVFLAEMRGLSRASMTIQQAVAVLQGADPLYGALPALTVRSRIVRYLTRPVDIENNKIVVRHEGRVPHVILE
jgi:hypothetical protein